MERRTESAIFARLKNIRKKPQLVGDQYQDALNIIKKIKQPEHERKSPWNINEYNTLFMAFRQSKTLAEVAAKIGKSRTWIKGYCRAEHSEL